MLAVYNGRFINSEEFQNFSLPIIHIILIPIYITLFIEKNN